MPASNKLSQRLFDLYGDVLLLEGYIDATPPFPAALLKQSLSDYQDSLTALDRFVATTTIRPAHSIILEDIRLSLDQVLTLDWDTERTCSADDRVAIRSASNLLRRAIAAIMDPEALERTVGTTADNLEGRYPLR
jgi:hypothetical protein